MMDVFSAMDILASGLGAERVRMNVTASNLANANTTRTQEGGPYKRRDAVFSSQPLDAMGDSPFANALSLVSIEEIAVDESAPKREFAPEHPDADADGFIARPNINLVEEMVNMITASRAYEAGITAMRSVVEMARKSMTLGQ